MGYYDKAIAKKEEYLEHHGILGQKWGVRRFESKNGTLTAAGRARYNTKDGKYQKIGSSGGKGGGSKRSSPSWAEVKSLRKKTGKNAISRTINVARNKSPEAKAYRKAYDQWSRNQDKQDAAKRASQTNENKKGLSDKQKRAIAAGLAVAGTVAAGAVAYKYRNQIKNGASKIKQSLNRENFNNAATKLGTKAGTVAGKAANGVSSLGSRAKQGYVNGMSKAGELAAKGANKAEALGSRAKQGYVNGMSKAGELAAKGANKAEALGSRATNAANKAAVKAASKAGTVAGKAVNGYVNGVSKVVNASNKVKTGIKNNYTKPIEKAASLGVNSRLAAQRVKSDVNKAIATGKSAPIVKRRAQFADQARQLAKDYYNPRGTSSDGAVSSLINRWLSGQGLMGERKVTSNMNTLSYLEDVLKASGYVKRK